MLVSSEYCRTTPITKMGFSQRSTCKAKGILPRTSVEHKGEYIKSEKYKGSRNRLRSRTRRSNHKLKTRKSMREGSRNRVRSIKHDSKCGVCSG
jgi:hypothetical protein